MRLGPDRLSYIDPQAWKDIYGHKKTNAKDRRFYDFVDMNRHPSIITVADDAEHGRIRRIFSAAFSDKALKEQQPLMRKYVDQLVRNIRRDISQDPESQFDAVKLYNFTTFDIMSDLTFGEPLGLLENSAYTSWVKGVFATIRLGVIANFVGESRWATSLFWKFEPPVLEKTRMTHVAHTEDRVTRRLQQDRDGPDIWNLVLRQPEGRQFSKDTMTSNASIFMIAGTETTATLLSGVTYYLLKNPEKMRKLVSEIRTSFDSEDQLDFESLQKLPYLSACLEEGLRYYPPVPLGLLRITPPGGSIICGEWVPGNVSRFSLPLAVYY